MEVFIPEIVGSIRKFYGAVLTDRGEYLHIGAHLTAISQRMWEGVQQGNETVFKEIANYHRDHLGRSASVLAGLDWTEVDCQQAIADEYGFGRWSEVSMQRTRYNGVFEEAVDALVEGDLPKIRSLINKRPLLPQEKSQYGHGATLLHYAVSNGVEIWRQQVPLNLPETVSFLLEKGADPGARMNVYGGSYTAAELLLSSLPPRNAGVFGELRTLLNT